MATVEELKEIIIELKVDLAKARVPYGNCPYAYYPGINGECREDGDCSVCKQEFWQRYRAEVEIWAEKL
jgi:hypothetical protein